MNKAYPLDTRQNPQEKPSAHVQEGGSRTLEALKKRYAFRITDHIKNTIEGLPENDPIARQYLPQLAEMDTLPQEQSDPIGDFAHTPIKGIVHRHKDRVLFKPANICAVYCRFCFRREMVGPGADILSPQERQEALAYIAAHPEIREVILTGGDPLVLSIRQLDEILSVLDAIPHLDMIRIHTRLPLADPGKITEALCSTLGKLQNPLYLSLHVNHARELTPEVRQAITALDKAGCMLLSQSVLLKGVNDSAETLEALFRALITLKVKPYYLHHPDLAPGTSHFRLSLSEGHTIFKKLQGRVSGICLPTYMLDIPGGYGKIPVTADYVKPLEDGTYIVTDNEGREHAYPKPAQAGGTA